MSISENLLPEFDQDGNDLPSPRQHINHLVHHRGQMRVYLRLVDVSVPSIYGPTADEKW